MSGSRRYHQGAGRGEPSTGAAPAAQHGRHGGHRKIQRRGDRSREDVTGAWGRWTAGGAAPTAQLAASSRSTAGGRGDETLALEGVDRKSVV